MGKEEGHDGADRRTRFASLFRCFGGKPGGLRPWGVFAIYISMMLAADFWLLSVQDVW